MDVIPNVENEQRTRWNGSAGRAWIDTQQVMDAILEPFEHLLAATVPAGSERSVVDIGCGTGATTLAVARRLGNDGRVSGIDISEQMVGAARARAEQEGSRAAFICADAQDHPFEPGSVDIFISRFGVMFFRDPVAAFVNLRRATTAEGVMHFVAWRSAADNPFMTTAERAAAPLLPNLPPRSPGGPGQFAFADKDLVRAILRDGGWTEIEVEPFNADCTLPEPVLVPFLTRFGPVGLALQEADESTRAKVTTAVRAAFEPFVHGTEVRFTGGSWNVRARAGA